MPQISHGFQQVRDAPALLRLLHVDNITDRICQLLGAAKDTPPTTPRATTSTGSSTLSGGNSSGPATTVSTPVLGPTSGKDSGRNTPAPVGPPKGKLIVEIQEARNILSSKYPYVVCTFESNEFISRGPKQDGNTENGRGNGHAVAEQEPSNLGRRVAIPMKSRQSSNTSLADAQNGGSGKSGSTGITNPNWGHEAVLYVLISISRCLIRC